MLVEITPSPGDSGTFQALWAINGNTTEKSNLHQRVFWILGLLIAFHPIFFFIVWLENSVFVDYIGSRLPLKPFHLHRVITTVGWLMPAEQKHFWYIIFFQCCNQSTTILALLWQQLSFWLLHVCPLDFQPFVSPPDPPCTPQKFDSVLYHENVRPNDIFILSLRLLKLLLYFFSSTFI